MGIIYKSTNPLACFIKNGKDPPNLEDTRCIGYKINSVYKGQTKRALKTRIKEHKATN